MSTTDRQLRDIGLFIQTSLSSYVKNEKQAVPPENLNWHQLQGIVRGRNLGPLFAFCQSTSRLPPPLVRDWQHQKMKTSLQNLAKLKVATDITAIAERVGIKIVAMRGSVLAHSIYQDPAMRPMHDIDLIIRPADKEKFLEAMRKAGHEPTHLFRSQYVYTIQNVLVEVHWYLLSNKRYREKIDSEVLVSTAAKQETTDGFYYRLHDTWEVIGLAVHAFTHHNLSQIYSLVDIGLYMQNVEVDWQEVADLSRDMGITRIMYLTFGFVNQYFGLGLDDKVLAPLPMKSQKAAQYYRYFMEQTLAKITLATHIGIKRSQFYAAETVENKFREFLRLFSAKELRFLFDLAKMNFKGQQQKLKA